MDQLTLFKEQIPMIKDIDFVDIGLLLNERIQEEFWLKKINTTCIKQVVLIVGLMMEQVYPYIKNVETGKSRMPSLMSGEGSYPRINLVNGLNQKKFYMHKMVADAFVVNPDPKNKVLVDHINHNVYDYKVSNLQWSSP